ncbi:hypothetical protein SAMN05421751_10629 [Jhaorihella thermophila]|uniref:Uncharacterized protein n=1 Tax=Jhaorihella thermophila TaxID=488547 RepID=A0A1H5VGA9_9RHOB|nr:hypothetical protein SAMN05421751_10629 [Jhaorihella thermophila]
MKETGNMDHGVRAVAREGHEMKKRCQGEIADHA